jgi:outer membrane lipoprotein
MRRFIFGMTLLVLAGCSVTPTVFNTPIEGSPEISDVIEDSGEQFAGQKVRWGGEIIAVRNQPEETWVEILQRPLSAAGRPQDKPSQGRFFIKLTGFVEPEDYTEGQSITAVGLLSGFINQKVGEFDYRYPVVDVAKEDHRLWQETSQRRRLQVRPSLYWDWPWFYSPYRHSVGARVIVIKEGDSQ